MMGKNGNLSISRFYDITHIFWYTEKMLNIFFIYLFA